VNNIVKNLTKVLALAAAAASLSTFVPATANAGSFWIKNSTPYYIWYTTYNTGFRTEKQQWGCLEPNTPAQTLTDSDYGKIVSNVYILGEIKKSKKDCNGGNKTTYGPKMFTLDPNGGRQFTFTNNNGTISNSEGYH
jgi:hypothetical protein